MPTEPMVGDTRNLTLLTRTSPATATADGCGLVRQPGNPRATLPRAHILVNSRRDRDPKRGRSMEFSPRSLVVTHQIAPIARAQAIALPCLRFETQIGCQ